MKTILALNFMLLVGCATTGTPVTDEQKQFTTIKDTLYQANDSYDRTLQFLAENLNDSKDAIQIKDKESKHIVSNLTVDCKTKNGMGMDYTLPTSFVFDFQAKDKKIKITMKAQYYEVDMLQYGKRRSDIHSAILPDIDLCQKGFILKMDKYFEQKKADW